MASSTLTGNEVIKINGRIISDLASGDVGALTFPNEIMNVATGKGGNSIFAFNESGRQCELVLRVLAGGGDDRYLNGKFSEMLADPPAFVLLTGEIVKRTGDGQGGVRDYTYILSGGAFSKNVEASVNTEGNIEQGISVYT
ncbi:MAG: hypothetical protein LBC18_15010, partial [Opitutaceae bacterium]|nr:hypothetical protein [Opitutaceae bacterium]